MNSRQTLILVGLLSAVIAGTAGFFIGRKSEEAAQVKVSALRAEAVRLREVEAGRAKPQEEQAGSRGGSGLPAAGGSLMATEESGDGAQGDSGSIRRILEQPGPMARWQDMMDLAVEGDEEAVATALEEMGELPIGIDTIVGKFFLYSRYADREPAVALEALADLPADELDLARASILGGWAGRAPAEAAAFLRQNINEEGNLDGVNNRMLGSVVGEWARTDPEAALAWSLELGEKSRRGAMDALLEQWAYNEPESAAKAMESFPEGEERKDLFQKVANRWAQKDHAAALAWAEKLPPEERAPAVGKAVESWAAEAPKAAAAYLVSMEEGAPRDYAMRRAAAAWSKEEPAGAADWVMQQPENDQRRKAMRDVMRTWVKEDSLAASEWLVKQPEGPATDSAIVSLANAVSEDDPEGAAIWSSAIADPITRAMQMKSVANGWLKRDPEAARAWIASAEMGEEMREELLAR